MEVKRSTWFKILATFIAFVMVIQILPLSVLANTKNHKFSESKIANVISKYNEENKSSNKIVTEMKDKRTEYSKTYLLDDNSYYCITVANPIHYLDEEKWTNLDERLDTIPNTTEEAENILIELSNAISQCGISLFSDGPTQISSNNIITNAIDFFPLENNSVKVTNGYQTSARFNGAAYLLVKPSLVYNYSANNLLIENANLCFQINTSNNKALRIKAYEENCGWESNTNLDNSYKNIEGLELLDSTSLLNSQTCKMNITDVFSKWERETLENNGVKLKFDISRDTVTVSDFCISVQYKNLSNDNTNYTYHTLDLGKAGTISINDITNTMTIKQDIIGINTNVLPVNISRTINSVLPTLHANGNVSGHWNYGFALELNDDIMTWKMPDGYNVKYQKIDKDIVNGYQKWEQITDGVAVYSTLWIDTDVDLDEFNMDYSKCYIEDNGSNYIYNFDVDGRLSSIKLNNHKINISYGSRGISQIEDSVGNKYKFTYSQYDIDGVKYYYVSKISAYDVSGNVIKIDGEDFDVNISVTYDSSNATIVNQEIFNDGSIVKYIFNKNGNLQKIECSDDSYVEFRYKNKENNYLVSYEYYSLENKEKTILNSLLISSDDTYYRLFTDQDNVTEEYSYNYDFQLVTYKDGKGNSNCISYDENGYIYSYSFRENEYSLLNNSTFEKELIEDGSWNVNNQNFYNYDSNVVRLRPSSSSVEIFQTANDVSKLLEGTTVVFGADAMVDNTYPYLNDDMFVGIIVYVGYKNLLDEKCYILPFDTSLDNDTQTRMMAFTLEDDCDYIDYSIVVRNQEGCTEVYCADLFIANESAILSPNVQVSDISKSDSYSCEYDDNENIINEKISQGDMFLSKSYQYNNNRLTSETDYNGITTYYEYDSLLNDLSRSGSLLDENGDIKNPTEYVYNANHLLEGVTATITSINNIGNSTSTTSLSSLYNYDSSNRITSVTNNGVTYSFDYFADGNIESVSVSGQDDDETGNQKLQQYEYDSNANINKIVYGNGSEITYTYQNDKIDTVSYYNTNNSENSALLQFNYSYDDNGEVSSVICNIADAVSNKNQTAKTKVVYTDNGYELYDFINTGDIETERLIYSTIDDFKSKTELLFADTSDDNNGTIDTAKTEYSSNIITDGTTDITDFNIDKSFLGLGSLKIDYNMESVIEKDSFGRITSNSIDRSFVNRSQPDNNGTFNYTSNYSYVTLDSETSQTSSLLSEYKITGDMMENSSLPESVASTVFKYDSRGNLQFKYYKFEESINCQQNDNCSCECDYENKRYCTERDKCCDECSCPIMQNYYVLGNYYGYDEQNQLVCEANPIDDKYATYTYDGSGNLCKRRIFTEVPNFQISDNPDFSVYELITMDEETFVGFDFGNFKNSLLLMDSDEYYECTYTFDPVFKDRMIGYTEKICVKNDDTIECEIVLDETINYDGSGNPLNYIGYNYEGLVRANLKWCGNLLTEFDILDNNGNIRKIFTYEYDQNGYRTAKKKYLKNNSGSFDLHSEQNFVWENGVLQGVIFKGAIYDYLTEKDSYNDAVTYSKIIYDSEGSPLGYVTPTGFMHQYIKDAQGNVIGLQVTGDDDGISCVEMSYDSWGQLTLNNIPDSNKLGYNSFMLTALFNPCTYKGYLYDYESGMYYAKNECYSPTWARNISTDGDYSSMMHSSSNPLDSNPYLFCNNNLISNNDIYAAWSTHDNGLSFFDSGFEIGINKGFLSRPLCELYAAQLIKNNGTYNYDVGANLCGMDKERIAINLFSNAVGYYSPKAINKVNANWGMGWLDSLSQTMNGKITVRSNEKEYIVNNYKQIWLAAPTIKNYAWSSGIFITV